MNGLPPDLQQLKGFFDTQRIPAFIGREWNSEYLSVPITVDTQHHRTVSARFGCIKGQPILTNLPYGRYVCVRIPCFYHWWDDLNRFSEVLEQANALACSLMQRDVRPEFFVDFVDSNVIFFKMDVLLNDDEAYCDALPDVYHQLNLIAKAVYGYLKAYDDEYEKKEVSR